jgi:hypothetical protein
MNSIQSIVGASIVAALASFGATLPAHASLSIHGSNCKAYINTVDNYEAIFSGSTGTANHHQQFSRPVICPVIWEAGSNGVTVWVEGRLSPGESMTCTLESRDGSYLASKSATLTAASFEYAFTMDKNQAPWWADLSLICSLPPKGRGAINAVSVSG